jgi:hypothetical protein
LLTRCGGKSAASGRDDVSLVESRRTSNGNGEMQVLRLRNPQSARVTSLRMTGFL